ncbi:MAG: TetR/AcrR family transcriptional regulator [Candidatus Neomarinimicrobiota bacterium]|nr:MAG: TetR/AcrR family transcriptional regulator [Candidatus Neomarinimicrobiota bacterium]
MMTIDPKQEILLQAVLEEINTFGVHGFTVDRLAQKAGVSKKTIYMHWTSKDEIVREAFKQIQRRIFRSFQDILDTEDNPVLQFTRMIDTARSVIRDFNVQVINDLKRKYPEVWEEMEAFRQEVTGIFKEIFVRAQEQGLVRKTINVHIAAILHIAIINRLFHPEFFLTNNLTPLDTLTTYKEILIGGLLTEKGHQIIQQQNSI